jgi:hypothetical protein
MNRRKDQQLEDQAHSALIAGTLLVAIAAAAMVWFKYIKPLLEWLE